MISMVDFHTHILPGIDDGCRDSSQSLELLQLEQQQGVDTVILTPHFYASQYSPERFLSKRQQAWERLQSYLPADAPRLLLGAEVQYFEGIGQIEQLDDLCIEGTKSILLEMPFSRWDTRTIDCVFGLQELGKVKVILAHIDRYLHMQKPEVFQEFRQVGIQMQVNAEFFTGFFQKRKAMSMLRKEEFQYIGTDCHNNSSRKPDWSTVPLEAKEANASNFVKLMAACTKQM